MQVHKNLLPIVVAASMGLHSTCYALEDPFTLFALAASKALTVFQQPFIEVTSTEAVYLREANALPLPDTQCMFTEISGEQMCVGNGFPTRLRLQPDENLKLGLHPLSTAEFNYNTSYKISAPIFISDPLFLRQDIFPELNPEAKAIATEVLQGAEQQRELIKKSRQRIRMWPLRNPNANLDEPEEENGEEETDMEWWWLEPEIDMAEEENDRPQVQHDNTLLLEPDTHYCLSPDTNRNHENDNQVIADDNSGKEDDSSDGSSDSGSEDEVKTDADSSVEFITTSIDPFPVSAEISDYWQGQMLKKIKTEPLSDEETKIDVPVATASIPHDVAHDIESMPPVKRKKRTHIGKKPCQCKICGKAFSKNNYLKVHRRIHSGEKPYQCKICGKAFLRNDNLKVHRRTHSGEKPYQCEICGRAFSQSNSLQKHHFTHTGTKPYQCEICGRALLHNSQVKVHLRTHTGEKPYQCEYCGKAFPRNDNLKRHQLTHTGERLYKCQVCGKTFTRNTHLQAHGRTHTGEKPKPKQQRLEVQGEYIDDDQQNLSGDGEE